MGLKDSLKRLFSTSKTVGTEKVEQSIEQVKGFTKENTEKVEEVIDQAKESIKEFARKAEEKANDLGEKIQGKADITKDQIEAKIEEVWAKVEDKAVTVVDNLEAKIRGAEPSAESDVSEDSKIEVPAETQDNAPKTKKSAEEPKEKSTLL